MNLHKMTLSRGGGHALLALALGGGLSACVVSGDDSEKTDDSSGTTNTGTATGTGTTETVDTAMIGGVYLVNADYDGTTVTGSIGFGFVDITGSIFSPESYGRDPWCAALGGLNDAAAPTAACPDCTWAFSFTVGAAVESGDYCDGDLSLDERFGMTGRTYEVGFDPAYYIQGIELPAVVLYFATYGWSAFMLDIGGYGYYIDGDANSFQAQRPWLVGSYPDIYPYAFYYYL